ncbi:type II secretion system protein [Planctomycetota bacterium]
MNPNVKYGHRYDWGFTLIELLVVIAVISVLLAISVPSLSYARSLASRLACAGNLRQIGLAWTGYLDDNHQRFPRRPSVQINYGGWPAQAATDMFWDSDWINRPLNPYCGSLDKTEITKQQAQVFRCPVNRVLPTDLRPDMTPFEYWGNTYTANTLLIGQDKLPEGDPNTTDFMKAVNHKITGKNTTGIMVTNPPGRVVLAGDAPWYSQWWQKASEEELDWHNKEGYFNIVFLSGRVEFVNIKQGKLVGGEYYINPFKDLNSLAKIP